MSRAVEEQSKRRLLRSVTEICLDLGSRALGTFSRMLRAIVGEPPTAHRARGNT